MDNLDWTQTDKMEAGPELDELIAKNIMFWKGYHPSTDMGDAWHVVEYLRANGCRVEVDTQGLLNNAFYGCHITYPPDKGAWHSVDADTAPLAICRMAIGLWLMYTNGYPWQNLPMPTMATA